MVEKLLRLWFPNQNMSSYSFCIARKKYIHMFIPCIGANNADNITITSVENVEVQSVPLIIIERKEHWTWLKKWDTTRKKISYWWHACWMCANALILMRMNSRRNWTGIESTRTKMWMQTWDGSHSDKNFKWLIKIDGIKIAADKLNAVNFTRWWKYSNWNVVLSCAVSMKCIFFYLSLPQ